MLSSVLNSPRAIQVNIEIMRAFIRLRRILASHAELARKLDNLEKKYDVQFKMSSTPSASSWPRRSQSGSGLGFIGRTKNNAPWMGRV
jgi:hypothetical protein